MNGSQRVAIFGGSFNPPHMGHVLAAAYLQATAEFERVLVVPVWRHAFEKALEPFEQRVEMCRLAFEGLRSVDVSDVERDAGSPSRTVRTLEMLQERHPRWQMRLVVGSDVILETHKWFAFERVVELAPLFVLGRAGYERGTHRASILPEVSSTQVRQALGRAARPFTDPELARLVPGNVLRYLEQQRLYIS